MSEPQYRWRQLTSEQGTELLAWRKARRHPWHSPPHRANMLNKGVTRMGIAAIYSPKSKYKVFWTLILAAPDDKRG